MIENPAGDRIWPYIEDIIGFKIPYKNLTRYNNYDYPLQKRTNFASNVYLDLKKDVIKPTITMERFSRSYNERSNIPQKLLFEIFKTIIDLFEKQK